MNWIHLLLGTKGRITRKSFLLGLLPILALLGFLVFYLRYLTGILPAWANIIIPTLLTVEAAYFTANLSLKRMHDYGRSAGWLLMLFSPLIVVAGFLIQQKYIPLQSYEGAVVLYTMAISLAFIGFLWMLTEMLFLRSHEKDNRYGPSPHAAH
ncbi:MAG: DUF805 domain-containing protein [bacterium]|nr:DUF805 domain-containing protein [bacterium]